MNTDNLFLALKLMIIGMTAVYIALIIVIYLGKALIVILNKFGNNEPQATQQNEDIHGKIIEAAIAKITNGKGKVNHIEKI
jgi:oxaloacetate decarboxylase gamma subunit